LDSPGLKGSDADRANNKEVAQGWFVDLRDRLCSEFESIEAELTEGPNVGLAPGKFSRQHWQRKGGGGGEMSIMRGRVFEKVGVNISTVFGAFDKEFQGVVPGTASNPQFWASGISVVAHMCSPLVPAVHMNTRHIVTERSWFGGGSDLTPMITNQKDSRDFHEAMKRVCAAHGPDYYERFSKWCDDYFYLPHRAEPRGIGGIFFDNLENDWLKDFSFTKDVGSAFLEIFPKIVRRNFQKKWSESQREEQLIKRGRYVEFNLLYDRGTQFGLKTSGNVDAILMSLPPVAKWP
tara:strand:- start:258 stop:1133 length:876 start_codon:yes stop_codon:yes gene_type:complete